MKNLVRKAKYSGETLYLLGEFKRKGSFYKALRFHEMKVAITVGLLIVACQVILLILLGVL